MIKLCGLEPSIPCIVICWEATPNRYAIHVELNINYKPKNRAFSIKKNNFCGDALFSMFSLHINSMNIQSSQPRHDLNIYNDSLLSITVYCATLMW